MGFTWFLSISKGEGCGEEVLCNQISLNHTGDSPGSVLRQRTQVMNLRRRDCGAREYVKFSALRASFPQCPIPRRLEHPGAWRSSSFLRRARKFLSLPLREVRIPVHHGPGAAFAFCAF